MSQTLPVVPLRFCEFDKKNLALRLASEYCGMPSSLVVEGIYNSVKFVPVPEGHRLFDPDQWDGEMMVYIPEPGSKCGWVRSLTIYHAW